MKHINTKTGTLLGTFSVAACIVTGVFTPYGVRNRAVAQSKPTLKTPPLERYTCYQVYAPTLTYTYMGYFVLQPGNKYIWGFGKGKSQSTVRGKGRYTFDAQGIHFVDGPLKAINGAFTIQDKGRHNLKLKVPIEKPYPEHSGFATWTCNCEQHDPAKKDKA